jgi:hypothetical protein
VTQKEASSQLLYHSLFSAASCIVTMSEALSLDNPIFCTYAICVVVLSIKMTAIAWTTVFYMLSSGGKGIYA